MSPWVTCLTPVWFNFLICFSKRLIEGGGRGWDWRHNQLNGRESEQIPEDSEGQESLACCSPWGYKESDTTLQLNNNNKISVPISGFLWRLTNILKALKGLPRRCFQCRGPGLDPWLGKQDTTSCTPWRKKKRKPRKNLAQIRAVLQMPNKHSNLNPALQQPRTVATVLCSCWDVKPNFLPGES